MKTKTVHTHVHSLIYLLLVCALSFGSLVQASGATAKKVKELVGAINDSELIIYEPEGTATHSVVIFTDVNCTHCRMLHDRMDEYLKNGIRVKYAAFPVHTNSRSLMEAVWCRKDRNTAMDEANQGVKVKAAACETPVEHHLDIALDLGMFGTPAIVTPEGRVLYGYMTGVEVLNVLDDNLVKVSPDSPAYHSNAK